MFCWKLFVLLYFFFWPRGNQNPYIEEEKTTQWPKEKVQKDKQRSTKHLPAEAHGRHKPTMTERLCYLISCERHLIRTVLHFITMLRRYIIESYRKQAIIINRRWKWINWSWFYVQGMFGFYLISIDFGSTNNLLTVVVDWWIVLLVLSATFINISAISWRPGLVVEEVGVPGENHRPWESNW